MKKVRKAKRTVKRMAASCVSAVASVLQSALFWVFAMTVCGAVSILSGIRDVFGSGWASIAAGVLGFVGSWLLARGIAANG